MTVSDNHNHQRIIIEGITESGEVFRPSDWAERVSGSLCTLRKRRIVYSPLLQPATTGGLHCVVLEPDLERMHPELYHSILEFARTNKLQIRYEKL